MLSIRPTVITLLLGFLPWLAGCGGAGGSVAKEFAGGDLYDEKAPADSTTEGVEADKPAPPRRIVLPVNRREDRGLVLTAKPRAEHVRAGSMLAVEMVVRNTTGAPITIPYTSGKHFDIVVFADPDQRKPVFVWSEGRFFTQTFEEPTLSAGSPLVRILEVPTSADKSLLQQGEEGDLTRPLGPGTWYLWGTHEGQPFLAHGPVVVVVEG